MILKLKMILSIVYHERKTKLVSKKKILNVRKIILLIMFFVIEFFFTIVHYQFFKKKHYLFENFLFILKIRNRRVVFEKLVKNDSKEKF